MWGDTRERTFGLRFKLAIYLCSAAVVAIPAAAAARSPSAGGSKPVALRSGSDLSSRLTDLTGPALRQQGWKRRARALALPATGAGSLVRVGDRVGVEIRLSSAAVPGEVVAAARRAGASRLSLSRRYRSVTALVGPGGLRRLGAIPGIAGVTELLMPVPGAACPAGDFVSEGDAMLGAAAARGQFGVDGSGIKVGVLSDSFATATGTPTSAAQDVAAGELPGASNPCGNTTPVQIIDDSLGPPGAKDEGRAMAQIVHDLAPGAEIAFARGGNLPTALNMADNVRALADAGADVITDDVTFLEEPFFQEGPINVAVKEVVAAGIPYFAHASNFNEVVGGADVNGWEAPSYRSTSCPAAVTGSSSCMDFDPGPGVDNTYRVQIPPFGKFQPDLQWAQPWNGVTTDFDLWAIAGMSGVAADEANVTNSQKPFEFLNISNPTPSTITIDMAISRYTGPGGGDSGTPRLKMIPIGSDAVPTEYTASAGGDVVGQQIFGHNAAAEAITSAAVPFLDNSTVEEFSSRGPATLYFGPVVDSSPAPALAAPRVVAKPDVAAIDCGANSFFGQSFLGVYRFCGTSAAAPHSAAVGALMRQRQPTATPEQIKATLIATANPVGSFPPTAAGAGLVDAPEAVGSVPAGPVDDACKKAKKKLKQAKAKLKKAKAKAKKAKGKAKVRAAKKVKKAKAKVKKAKKKVKKACK